MSDCGFPTKIVGRQKSLRMDKQKEQRYSNVRFEHFWPSAHPVSDPKTSRFGHPGRICVGRGRVGRDSAEFCRQQAVSRPREVVADCAGLDELATRVVFVLTRRFPRREQSLRGAQRIFAESAQKRHLVRFWSLEGDFSKNAKSKPNSKFDTLNANFRTGDPKWPKTAEDVAEVISVRFGPCLESWWDVLDGWLVKTGRVRKKCWRKSRENFQN
jgi:hypothetical protein